MIILFEKQNLHLLKFKLIFLLYYNILLISLYENKFDSNFGRTLAAKCCIVFIFPAGV